MEARHQRMKRPRKTGPSRSSIAFAVATFAVFAGTVTFALLKPDVIQVLPWILLSELVLLLALLGLINQTFLHDLLLILFGRNKNDKDK